MRRRSIRKKEKHALLFDFSNLLFKGLAVHQDLSFGGKPTGGIYGFITQFSSQVNRFKPSHVFVCGDKSPYFRKELYPEYKGNRKRKDDDFLEIFLYNKSRCTEFLDLLGVELLTGKGFEADDLIASICDRYFSTFEKITIISNDKDLFQLFKYSNVCLQRNKILYGRDDFLEEYKVLPEEWDWVLAMSGTHNNVKGLYRVGEKTALKIYNDKERLSQVWKENKETLDLYRRIIQLPIKGFELPNIVIPEKHNYGEHKMMVFMSRLGIRLEQYMRNAFDIIT